MNRGSLGERVRQRQLATRKEAEKVLAERKAQKMEEALRNRHEIIQHYQNYKPSIAKPEEGDGLQDLGKIVQNNQALLKEAGYHQNSTPQRRRVSRRRNDDVAAPIGRPDRGAAPPEALTSRKERAAPGHKDHFSGGHMVLGDNANPGNDRDAMWNRKRRTQASKPDREVSQKMSEVLPPPNHRPHVTSEDITPVRRNSGGGNAFAFGGKKGGGGRAKKEEYARELEAQIKRKREIEDTKAKGPNVTVDRKESFPNTTGGWETKKVGNRRQKQEEYRKALEAQIREKEKSGDENPPRYSNSNPPKNSNPSPPRNPSPRHPSQNPALEGGGRRASEDGYRNPGDGNPNPGKGYRNPRDGYRNPREEYRDPGEGPLRNSRGPLPNLGEKKESQISKKEAYKRELDAQIAAKAVQKNQENGQSRGERRGLGFGGGAPHMREEERARNKKLEYKRELDNQMRQNEERRRVENERNNHAVRGFPAPQQRTGYVDYEAEQKLHRQAEYKRDLERQIRENEERSYQDKRINRRVTFADGRAPGTAVSNVDGGGYGYAIPPERDPKAEYRRQLQMQMAENERRKRAEFEAKRREVPGRWKDNYYDPDPTNPSHAPQVRKNIATLYGDFDENEIAMRERKRREYLSSLDEQIRLKRERQGGLHVYGAPAHPPQQAYGTPDPRGYQDRRGYPARAPERPRWGEGMRGMGQVGGMSEKARRQAEYRRDLQQQMREKEARNCRNKPVVSGSPKSGNYWEAISPAREAARGLGAFGEEREKRGLEDERGNRGAREEEMERLRRSFENQQVDPFGRPGPGAGRVRGPANTNFSTAPTPARSRREIEVERLQGVMLKKHDNASRGPVRRVGNAHGSGLRDLRGGGNAGEADKRRRYAEDLKEQMRLKNERVQREKEAKRLQEEQDERNIQKYSSYGGRGNPQREKQASPKSAFLSNPANPSPMPKKRDRVAGFGGGRRGGRGGGGGGGEGGFMIGGGEAEKERRRKQELNYREELRRQAEEVSRRKKELEEKRRMDDQMLDAKIKRDLNPKKSNPKKSNPHPNFNRNPNPIPNPNHSQVYQSASDAQGNFEKIPKEDGRFMGVGGLGRVEAGYIVPEETNIALSAGGIPLEKGGGVGGAGSTLGSGSDGFGFGIVLQEVKAVKDLLQRHERETLQKEADQAKKEAEFAKAELRKIQNQIKNNQHIPTRPQTGAAEDNGYNEKKLFAARQRPRRKGGASERHRSRRSRPSSAATGSKQDVGSLLPEELRLRESVAVQLGVLRDMNIRLDRSIASSGGLGRPRGRRDRRERHGPSEEEGMAGVPPNKARPWSQETYSQFSKSIRGSEYPILVSAAAKLTKASPRQSRIDLTDSLRGSSHLLPVDVSRISVALKKPEPKETLLKPESPKSARMAYVTGFRFPEEKDGEEEEGFIPVEDSLTIPNPFTESNPNPKEAITAHDNPDPSLIQKPMTPSVVGPPSRSGSVSTFLEPTPDIEGIMKVHREKLERLAKYDVEAKDISSTERKANARDMIAEFLQKDKLLESKGPELSEFDPEKEPLTPSALLAVNSRWVEQNMDDRSEVSFN